MYNGFGCCNGLFYLSSCVHFVLQNIFAFARLLMHLDGYLHETILNRTIILMRCLKRIHFSFGAIFFGNSV